MEPKIKANYVDTGKVMYVWHHFPKLGDASRRAAAASVCAHEQGRFWDYHTRLYHNAGDFSSGTLKAHAAALGLDGSAFAACVDSGAHTATVQKQYDQARQMKIQYTPSFLLNGRLIIGLRSYQAWEQLLNDELKKVSQ